MLRSFRGIFDNPSRPAAPNRGIKMIDRRSPVLQRKLTNNHEKAAESIDVLENHHSFKEVLQ
jgi:hypothetical protein